MVQLNINLVSRNAQIFKFASHQEHLTLEWARFFRGRLLETRRKPRHNAICSYHIENVQALDRGRRMSCVNSLAGLFLYASRDMRVSTPKRHNFIDPEVLHGRATDTTSAGQRDSRLNFNHTLNGTCELSAQSVGRCVVVKVSECGHGRYLENIFWGQILFHLL